MTTDQIAQAIKDRLEQIEAEERRCKDALLALDGKKRPGRKPKSA